MREIGGYIELDTYHLSMLHEDAIALNCGRNALAYLLRARNIKRLWIPRFICDSVTGVCKREQVPYSFYRIGLDFLPCEDIQLGEGEWLYFVNYYSQFDNDTISGFIHKYKRVIVDQAQSYFQMPIPDADTIYTCRKYFGVADGAFLYTSAVLEEELPVDESFERMHFLLGRFERAASEFYGEYVSNNKMFTNEPIKKMSKLTQNLLHGIDYPCVKTIRQRNYSYLHKVLCERNKLKLNNMPGTFMYPLMIAHGSLVRKKLQERKIFIPTLWPSVFEVAKPGEQEYEMAENILPLPIDQRYNEVALNYIINMLLG